jgi:hypothetical protein
MYIHTNITTCSVTKSQCPVFLFYNFIHLFFKIHTYQRHKPISVVDFGWGGNHVKPLISQYLQNLCSFNFGFGGFGGLQLGSPPPSPAAPLLQDIRTERLFVAWLITVPDQPLASSPWAGRKISHFPSLKPINVVNRVVLRWGKLLLILRPNRRTAHTAVSDVSERNSS